MSSNLSPPIENLRVLHRILLQLTDLRARRRRGPNLISAHDANLAKQKGEVERLRDENTKMKVATDAKQGRLRDGEEKISKLKIQLNLASSNREYQTLKEQLAAAEMANSVLADEILEGFERLDDMVEKLAAAEILLQKTTAEAEKAKHAVEKEMPRVDADIKRLEADLADHENRLEGDFKTLYLRISKVKGEETLAPLKGEYCGGCSRLVPLNHISHLLLDNPKPVVCGGCGRMLYVTEGWTQK